MSTQHLTETSASRGHSASVILLLHFNGHTHELSDVGPDHATLRAPGVTEATEALLEVITDGRSWRRRVRVQPDPAHPLRILML